MKKIAVAAVASFLVGCGGGSSGGSDPVQNDAPDIISVSGIYSIVEEDAVRQCSGTLAPIFGGTTDAGVEARFSVVQTGSQLRAVINDTDYFGTMQDDLSFEVFSADTAGNILFTSTMTGQFTTFGRVSGIITDVQAENFVDENNYDGICGSDAYFEGVLR